MRRCTKYTDDLVHADAQITLPYLVCADAQNTLSKYMAMYGAKNKLLGLNA